MNVFVLINEATQGPLDAEQLRAAMRNGSVSMASLGWIEGQVQWLPLAQMPSVVAGLLPPLPPPQTNSSKATATLPTPPPPPPVSVPLKRQEANLTPPSPSPFGTFVAMLVLGLLLLGAIAFTIGLPIAVSRTNAELSRLGIGPERHGSPWKGILAGLACSAIVSVHLAKTVRVWRESKARVPSPP